MSVLNAAILERILNVSGIHRSFHTSCIQLKHVTLKNTKNKTASSQQWLLRQLRDPYVELAKMQNYRCRSAFKLLEINDKYNILHPGQTVIDCGASPGSWTQVAVNKVNSNAKDPNSKIGKVIAIDIQGIYPVEGAIMLGNCDFTKTENQDKIALLLENKKANVIISDMAPNATGLRELDVERIINFCYSVAKFALKTLKVDTESALLMKIWQCNESKKLETDLQRVFNRVRFCKPNSSRSNSSEIFILATNFKGLYIF